MVVGALCPKTTISPFAQNRLYILCYFIISASSLYHIKGEMSIPFSKKFYSVQIISIAAATTIF